MLSLFSIPKACEGFIGLIQENAFRSWAALDLDVTLLGDDPGVAEAAARHGFRHEPAIARNAEGTPLVSSVFERAIALARGPRLAYVNADIILFADFPAAAARLPDEAFLMVGRRTNLDVREALSFDGEGLRSLRERAASEGERAGPTAIDYFVFPPGLYAGAVPPFAIGRFHWDNWLIYHAARSGARVIDATPAVLAVHQNHGYGAGQRVGVSEARRSPQAARNRALLGPSSRAFDLEHAAWELGPEGLRRRGSGEIDFYHRWGARLASRPLLFRAYGLAARCAEGGLPEAVKRPLRRLVFGPQRKP